MKTTNEGASADNPIMVSIQLLNNGNLIITFEFVFGKDVLSNVSGNY